MHLTNTRVILLRHGQSTYNALKLYQGSSDRPNLTELGCQQAQLTGAFLKAIPFDAIYSSPLKRARETATAVATYQGEGNTIVQIIPHLRETELPQWQGLPIQFVKELFPEDYLTWKQRPHEFRMEIPSVESGEGRGEMNKTITKIQNQQYCYPALDLYERIYQFWQEILPRHVGQTLLIVSHGGTNRALISTALGLSPTHYHCIEQSNCAVSILNFPDGCLESGKLALMNHATHVGETFPAVKEGLRLLLVPLATENLDKIEQLTHLLQEMTIDFSISSDRMNNSIITEQILQYHPQTIQFQVLREDFPQLWQQAITTKNSTNDSQLLTGLVVVSDRTIQKFLGQVLGMNTDQLSRLHLSPGTVHIIHYPNSDHPPILQGMNIEKILDYRF